MPAAVSLAPMKFTGFLLNLGLGLLATASASVSSAAWAKTDLICTVEKIYDHGFFGGSLAAMNGPAADDDRTYVSYGRFKGEEFLTVGTERFAGDQITVDQSLAGTRVRARSSSGSGAAFSWNYPSQGACAYLETSAGKRIARLNCLYFSDPGRRCSEW